MKCKNCGAYLPSYEQGPLCMKCSNKAAFAANLAASAPDGEPTKIAHIVIDWPISLNLLSTVCDTIATYAGEDSAIQPVTRPIINTVHFQTFIQPIGGRQIILRVKLDIIHFTEDKQEIDASLQAMCKALLQLPKVQEVYIVSEAI